MSTETAAAMIGAGEFALPIEQACIEFGLETALDKAYFLSQIAHESGGFRYVREIWGPTPAQARYEGRRDLGNTVKGDGYRFRGRGLIQITGRDNYRAYSHAMYGDDRCLMSPELLEQVPDVALCAGWYWRWRGISVAANRDDLVLVTKMVNGGLNGLADRAKWLAKAKDAFRELGADLP